MALTAEQRAQMRSEIGSALDGFSQSFTDDRLLYYIGFHRDRYQFIVVELLDLLSRMSKPTGGQRVLDIGPRVEVGLLHRLDPSLRVDILGLNAGVFPLNEGETFFKVDLTDVDADGPRPPLGEYHAILMAEVIEHLWTAPSLILPWLRTLLIPGGYFVVQTPNAANLPNRLRLLMGRQPFEMLSADPAIRGHIREYTINELVREGTNAGFEVVSVRTANYFNTGSRSNDIYRRLARILPRSLRSGITVVYRRPLGE